MKVAIVCDWLTSVGGAERVLKSITELFPDAPIYTSQYNKKKIDWFNDKEVKVGWLQIFPSCFRKFLGPLRQHYFSHLDLSSYDLIISVTGAEAKSVKKGNALHLCYCHVPTQYYWGLKDDYLKNPGFGILNPLARLGLKLFLKPLKKADYEAAQLPDAFITISTYAKEEIKKAYGREATIIFPPVAVEKFSTGFSTSKLSTVQNAIKNNKKQPEKTEQSERRGFVVTSRQVNWKRLDLAVKTCENLKLPLTVIGEGPEHRNLVKLAKNSKIIKFLPLTNQAHLKLYLEKAEGYIFPSLEPFGIAPVEALACGCPVIAYGNGGALDYVIDGENGVLFGKQSVNSLRQSLKRFQTIRFDEQKIIKSAAPFSEAVFKTKIKAFVVEKVKEKKNIKPEKNNANQKTKERKIKRIEYKPIEPKPQKPTRPPKPRPPVRPQTVKAQPIQKPTAKIKKPLPVQKPAAKAKRPLLVQKPTPPLKKIEPLKEKAPEKKESKQEDSIVKINFINKNNDKPAKNPTEEKTDRGKTIPVTFK